MAGSGDVGNLSMVERAARVGAGGGDDTSVGGENGQMLFGVRPNPLVLLLPCLFFDHSPLLRLFKISQTHVLCMSLQKANTQNQNFPLPFKLIRRCIQSMG